MNFRHTLSRRAQDVTIITKTDGGYNEDTGIWADGEESTETVEAVVLPLNRDDLQQGQGGTYTADDRKLYIHQELDRGQKVETNNDRYIVDGVKDYSKHASGLRIYYLKRRGAAGD